MKQNTLLINMVNKIQVFTDGAFATSKTVMGYAFVVLKDEEKIYSWSNGQNGGTNIRAEILACYYAIKWCKDNNISEFEILTDSMQLIGTYTKNWKRNKNNDLWDAMDKLIKGLSITWTKVKGHTGNKYNELCDCLAVTASNVEYE